MNYGVRFFQPISVLEIVGNWANPRAVLRKFYVSITLNITFELSCGNEASDALCVQA